MKENWTISFLAEKEGERHDRKVVMRIMWDNNLVRYLIGFRVDCTPTKIVKKGIKKWPCRWDWDKQRCKNNTTHGNYSSTVINKRINNWEEKANEIFQSYYFVKKRVPTVKEFQSEFSNTGNTKDTFFTVFDKFVENAGKGKSWSKSVYNKFRALRSHLLEYNPRLTVDFNKDDADGLIQWYIDKGYRNTTAYKNSSLLKWLLNWAASEGYYKGNVHTKAWRVRLKGSDMSDNILFLEWDEVMKLWELEPIKYTPEDKNDPLPSVGAITLQNVKDCFLFQCFTGLRYSDLKQVKRSNIHNNTLKIVTVKSLDNTAIELNTFSRKILEKYKDIPFENDLALPVISNQKMNTYLKIICKQAEINELYTEVYYIGAERKEEINPKWKVIGTHCGRRTYVVTSLALGIPPEVVMKFTGHSDYNAMKPYIAIVEKSKQEAVNKFDELYKNI